MIILSLSSLWPSLTATFSLQSLLIISIIGMMNAQQSASSIPLMTTFDATWDALKCAMKISLIQMAKYHNNQMSCCGLWVMKWFIKSSAEEYCERPEGAKQVFDQYINGDLIYNQMVRSVLGDPDLSCDPYPEGSSACTRLWIMLILLIVIGILSVYIIIMWCCCVTCFWCRTRKENRRLRERILGIDGPENSTITSVSTTNSIIDNGKSGQQQQSQPQRNDNGDKNRSLTTNQPPPHTHLNPLHDQLHSMNQQEKVSNNFLAINAYSKPLQIRTDSLSDKIPIPIDDDDFVTNESINNDDNNNLLPDNRTNQPNDNEV